jgi:plastocyanin
MRAGSGFVKTGIVAGMLGLMAACGGGGSTPTSPSGGGGSSARVSSTGAVGTSGATFTIGANGAISPAQVTIAVGQSVTFVNNDSRTHDMESDPHPTHTNCPSIANVNILSPGQTKLTFGFAGTGTCGFHDHNNPDSGSLKGTIVIQ